MEIHIFKLIGNNKNVIHRVKIPSYNEKKWYVTMISLSAFRNGKRSNHSAESAKIYAHTCSYSPDGLYYYYDKESEWLKRNKETLESFSRRSIDYSGLDETKLDVVEHDDLFSFYKYIGFNYKKRKYETKKDKS